MVRDHVHEWKFWLERTHILGKNAVSAKVLDDLVAVSDFRKILQFFSSYNPKSNQSCVIDSFQRKWCKKEDEEEDDKEGAA